MRTPTAHVAAVGVAAPSLRLAAADVAAAWGRAGGRGQCGVCAHDEDQLTLAWEAADTAITAAGLTADAVDGMWWGTSRPPFAEGPSHAQLAAALGLRTDAGGALTAGSSHAGMEALLGAWDAVAAGAVSVALVVVSDAVVPGTGTSMETAAGAGAAAVVVTAADGPATLTARATRSRPVLDRYRGDGEEETRDTYDARLFREQVFLPAMAALGETLPGADGQRWSLPDPDGRLGRAAAAVLGSASPASAAARAELGDTGAAAALVGGAAALAEPGPLTLVGMGGGRATGVVVEVSAPIPGAGAVAARLKRGRAASYAEVLRARRRLVPAGEQVEMAVPPGSAMFVRGGPEVLGLLGGRCVACGTLNVPPSIHPTCVACGADKFDLVPLARRGRVHTFVVNHAMPAPFEAPLPLAVLDLEDGGRVMLQVVGTGAELAVDTPVELVLRRYAVERGVPIYGWKARAVDGGGKG